MKKDARRLCRDEIEARAALRRAVENAKPETAATAARILSDPDAFASFVELRRQRRLRRILKDRAGANAPEVKVEAKPRWSFRTWFESFLRVRTTATA